MSMSSMLSSQRAVKAVALLVIAAVLGTVVVAIMATNGGGQNEAAAAGNPAGAESTQADRDASHAAEVNALRKVFGLAADADLGAAEQDPAEPGTIVTVPKAIDMRKVLARMSADRYVTQSVDCSPSAACPKGSGAVEKTADFATKQPTLSKNACRQALAGAIAGSVTTMQCILAQPPTTDGTPVGPTLGIVYSGGVMRVGAFVILGSSAADGGAQ